MVVPSVDIAGGTVSLGGAQGQGARSYQEDSFGFSNLSGTEVTKKGVLAVLADGMGGLKNGKAVSDTTVSSLLSWFDSQDAVCTCAEDLKNTISLMNQRICDIYCKGGKVEAGSTVVAVLVNNGYFHWLSIGDSRIYLKRGGKLYQINEDHDYLNQMLSDVIDGTSTIESAYSNMQKDSLVGCIGKRDLDCFDYSKKGFKMHPGDILVLCSDGVYNSLSLAEFNMNVSSDAIKSCENIIGLVEQKKIPNQDNNTVVIISYKG